MTRRHVETSDLPPRGIALSLVALFATLIIVMAGVAWFTSATTDKSIHRSRPGSVKAPAPQLLADPTAQRLAIETAERRRLNDRAAIPIDRAMQMVARRGWGEDAAAPGTEATARAHIAAKAAP